MGLSSSLPTFRGYFALHSGSSYMYKAPIYGSSKFIYIPPSHTHTNTTMVILNNYMFCYIYPAKNMQIVSVSTGHEDLYLSHE